MVKRRGELARDHLCRPCWGAGGGGPRKPYTTPVLGGGGGCVGPPPGNLGCETAKGGGAGGDTGGLPVPAFVETGGVGALVCPLGRSGGGGGVWVGVGYEDGKGRVPIPGIEGAGGGTSNPPATGDPPGRIGGDGGGPEDDPTEGGGPSILRKSPIIFEVGLDPLELGEDRFGGANDPVELLVFVGEDSKGGGGGKLLSLTGAGGSSCHQDSDSVAARFPHHFSRSSQGCFSSVKICGGGLPSSHFIQRSLIALCMRSSSAILTLYF